MNMHDWVEGRKAGGLPCPHLRPCKEQYEELAFSLSPIQQVGKYFQIISFCEINSFPYVCVSWCIYSGRQGMKSKSIFCGMIYISLSVSSSSIYYPISLFHAHTHASTRPEAPFQIFIWGKEREEEEEVRFRFPNLERAYIGFYPSPSTFSFICNDGHMKITHRTHIYSMLNVGMYFWSFFWIVLVNFTCVGCW